MTCGRGTFDQLGKAALDVRNPYIAGALELFNQSENRYSGKPALLTPYNSSNRAR